MFLIPLDETIEFNQTEVGASFLAGLYIAAFTYHPVYEQLLYLIYIVSSRARAQPSLMIWDSYTQNFLQNITLDEELNCNGKCTLKVTEDLILIESPSIISIYRLIQLKADANRVVLYSKDTGFSYDDTSKQADIYRSKFVFFQHNQTIFGQVNQTSYRIFYYNFNITNSSSLQIGLDSQMLYVVFDASNISVLFFKCVACIYDGRLTYPPANNTGYISIIRFNRSLINSIKVYKANQQTMYKNKIGYIFWAVIDGDQYQYFTDTTNQSESIYSEGTFPIGSTANKDLFMVFNQSDGIFTLKPFEPYNSSQQSAKYDYGRIIKKAAIAESLETYAIYEYIYYPKLTQYQKVDSCQQYNANANILNTLFCDCTLYNQLNRCALKQSKASSTTFPIYGIIGIIASMVLIILAVYFFKNNYKKCLKSSKRIPWKYNPVELMSFQV